MKSITFNCCLIRFLEWWEKEWVEETFVTINQFPSALPQLKINSRKQWEEDEDKTSSVKTMYKKSFLIEYLAFLASRASTVLVDFAVK